MIELSSQLTQMSIDIKKNRIRVHKESLHLIGDPKYIQILVNINNRLIAIMAIETDQTDLQSYRVDQNRMESDFSFEIYSSPFIKKLCNEFNCFKKGKCYRLTGTAVGVEKTVVFNIDSLQEIESM